MAEPKSAIFGKYQVVVGIAGLCVALAGQFMILVRQLDMLTQKEAEIERQDTRQDDAIKQLQTIEQQHQVDDIGQTKDIEELKSRRNGQRE